MSYSVAIVSSGRPEILRQTVASILAQSVAPAEIVLSTINQADWPAAAGDDPRIRHIWGKKGIPVQLNAAVDAFAGSDEFVFIFDDDVVLAPDYCERALAWFREEPALLAFDGHVLRDGNVTHAEAVAVLEAERQNRPHRRIDRSQIYGCNICTRRSTLKLERFDEALEGYAWLFEFDWVRRVRRHGPTGRVFDCHIVHLMAQSGRMPGFKLGYMQIFHPVYLSRKGLIPFGELHRKFIWKHILINGVKSLTGDAKVDRLGRFKGNMRAILNICKGQKTPKLPA